jgi:hypothetical protein
METETNAFIKTTIEKIIKEETENALKEVKQTAFYKAKEIFAPLFNYGAISKEDFMIVCIELGIATPKDFQTKTKLNTNSATIYDDGCGVGSVFGPRSAC